MSGYIDHPDGVVIVDRERLVTSVNPAALRLLSRASEECVGLDYRKVLPLQDEQGRDWWACTDPFGGLSTRTRQPERRLQLVGDRGVVDLLVTASFVRVQGQVERLVIALRDTRTRDRIERSRADLVSTVAHELRSPLTSVKGFTATLLARWDRFTDEQKKVMLATVNADADRVTRLLTELLDVSRIDAGRLEMRVQVVDLARAVAKVVDGFIAGGEPRSRFVVTVRSGLPEMWLDPDKVTQVLGNLVENALRHGDGTITITVDPSDAGAEVTVGDEGAGIPEETVGRVFTRFWRGGNRRGGTGLGLYIVKGLVEAHGGGIEVERADSGGALFRLRLPAGRPPFEA